MQQRSALLVTPAVFGRDGIFGGGERYVHSIAEALTRAASERYRVAIVGFTDQNPRVYQDGEVRVFLVKTDNWALNRLEWYGRGLWNVLKDFDLIHVHQPFTRCGEVALCAAATSGKPVVATDLGGAYLPADPADHPISFVDRIIAISAFSAGTWGGRAPAPVRVVIGPVGERFAASPLASEKAGALYVGRIMPHKGIDRLIRAAPPGLQITIAGKTYDSDYEKHLHQLASGKAVRFVDNPDDDELASLYARAAIHVAPSVVRDYLGKFHPNAELMGLTTLESLASGTAVAVADTCSLPELIAGGNVGECFSSEAELAGILSRVLDGSWVDQYPSARCRAFALDSYAPDVVGRAIADIYDDAFQARGLE